jgi:hypothetical protein
MYLLSSNYQLVEVFKSTVLQINNKHLCHTIVFTFAGISNNFQIYLKGLPEYESLIPENRSKTVFLTSNPANGR